MEIARMNYYFTGILVILFVLLCFMKPAYPRNEYLNDGTNSCSTGDVSLSIEQRDDEYNYRHNSNSNNYDGFDNDRNIRLTWRKYLGSACTDDFKRVQQENMELKQQLELMKMCGRVNNNPTLQRNPSFALIVAKCSGIVIPENKKPDGSHWDDLKDDYKKENPDVKLMGDSKLLMPKDLEGPLPEPIDEEAAWNEIE